MRLPKVASSLMVGACLLVLAGCGAPATGTTAPKAAKSAARTAQVRAAGQEVVEATSAGVPESGIARPAPVAGEADPVAVAIEKVAKDSKTAAKGLTGKIVASVRNGGEAWVHVRVKAVDGDGESEEVFLSRKTDGAWQVRTYGTGTSPEDLVSLFGLPAGLAEALFPR